MCYDNGVRSILERFRLRSIRRAALVLVVAGLCAACDASLSSPPVSSSCAQIGAQCQLPGGPLGVCQELACAPGATAPCFTCTSQH